MSEGPGGWRGRPPAAQVPRSRSEWHKPDGKGTRVTITENGEVTSLFFRIMSKLFFGHTATIDRTLTALQRALL